MRGVIQRFHRFLPIDPRWIVSLDEGETPLLPAERLAWLIFGDESRRLYLKLEGLNPTGSFKDRGMTYAISKAVELEKKAVICASTGNTSASAAAYAARAGLKAYVIVPRGRIARGKLSQALIHGARVVEVRAGFDEALTIVRDLAREGVATLVNSINPHRLEGQKTAAFEICEALGRSPTHHILPVGNAGNMTACWRGYREWREAGKIDSLPKMLGFQAAGAAPIVLGRPVKDPKTVASAIRIGNPALWKEVVKARDESGGLIGKVTDREIMLAYRMIAETEGYFCEPASAASVAGLIKLSREGYFKGGEIIVCTLTGHGLKDPDAALKIARPPVVVSPRLQEVRKALRL